MEQQIVAAPQPPVAAPAIETAGQHPSATCPPLAVGKATVAAGTCLSPPASLAGAALLPPPTPALLEPLSRLNSFPVALSDASSDDLGHPSELEGIDEAATWDAATSGSPLGTIKAADTGADKPPAVPQTLVLAFTATTAGAEAAAAPPGARRRLSFGGAAGAQRLEGRPEDGSEAATAAAPAADKEEEKAAALAEVLKAAPVAAAVQAPLAAAAPPTPSKEPPHHPREATRTRQPRAAAAGAPGAAWRALRTAALMSLLVAGPLAALLRQPALLSDLARAVDGGARALADRTPPPPQLRQLQFAYASPAGGAAPMLAALASARAAAAGARAALRARLSEAARSLAFSYAAFGGDAAGPVPPGVIGGPGGASAAAASSLAGFPGAAPAQALGSLSSALSSASGGAVHLLQAVSSSYAALKAGAARRGASRAAPAAAAAADGGGEAAPSGSVADPQAGSGPASGGAGGGGGGSDASDAVHMVAVVGEARASPLKGTPWGEVVRHMSDRLAWSDPRFKLEVISEQDLQDPSVRESLSRRLSSGRVPLFTAAGITDPAAASFLLEATGKLPTALFWDCPPELAAAHRVDGYSPAAAGPLASFAARAVSWSREARAARVLGTLADLFGRATSDDLLYTWLVVINEYVTEVPAVANTTKGSDLKSIQCMVTHCLKEIVNCVTDKTCKAGLDCLQGCKFNDQVCQYRCIVSYETPQFTDFSLCILQKHNCRSLSAVPPTIPDPSPMTSFQGRPLTHEAAEGIKRGWLGGPTPGGAKKEWSWLVAGGKNPAYDAFPCQHQLYYPGKGSAFWYEPVFQVVTLEGEAVWRRRKYRVRRGEAPGTFYYSVLDNGITSEEYWRILDAPDDLSYSLFYYTGAASRAGMSYSGAVLGTPDGRWPEQHADRIAKALDRAGIKPWELSTVDNSNCVGAPLAL